MVLLVLRGASMLAWAGFAVVVCVHPSADAPTNRWMLALAVLAAVWNAYALTRRLRRGSPLPGPTLREQIAARRVDRPAEATSHPGPLSQEERG